MQKPSKQNFVHIIIVIAIFTILLISMVRLIKWNNGKKIDYGPDYISEDDLLDNEDYLTAFDPKRLAGRTDDGITTIVMMGDDSLNSDRTANGIAELVASKCDATVYNISFDGSSFANNSVNLNMDDYPIDAFSPYRIGTCIESEDFALLDWGITMLPNPKPDVAKTVELLKTIDFDKVDIVILHYGLNDYLQGLLPTNVADEEYIGSTTGALLQTIKLFERKYPHIRIIVSSPNFCYYEEEDGSIEGADIRRTGSNDIQYNLGDYMIAMKAISVDASVTFVDNYFGVAINANNGKDYLKDNTTLNKKGNELVANHISDIISNKLY